MVTFTGSTPVGKQLAGLLPDVFFTLSSEVAPQIREYPRASTAAVNAYAMPISLPYLRGLSERLKREKFPLDIRAEIPLLAKASFAQASEGEAMKRAPLTASTTSTMPHWPFRRAR